jgi:acetyl/propionyl-CoA carboxylase alpha subunit
LPEVPERSGHAFEARIYAEDPDAGFLPQSGRILQVHWPEDARIDTGIEEGTTVTTFYDPLLAKLIVHGHTRDESLQRLREALADTSILGFRTNLSLLAALTTDDRVRTGTITTDYFEHAYGEWRMPADPARAARVAAAAEARYVRATNDPDPWRSLGPDETLVVVRDASTEYVVRVRRDEVTGGIVVRADDRWYVWFEGAPYEFEVGPAPRRLSAAASHLDAPLPGQVLAVRVSSGDAVSKGDELVVIEAMKMEHAIRAPSDGTVTSVLCAAGDQVARGQTLVGFTAADAG